MPSVAAYPTNTNSPSLRLNVRQNVQDSLEQQNQHDNSTDTNHHLLLVCAKSWRCRPTQTASAARSPCPTPLPLNAGSKTGVTSHLRSLHLRPRPRAQRRPPGPDRPAHQLITARLADQGTQSTILLLPSFLDFLDN